MLSRRCSLAHVDVCPAQLHYRTNTYNLTHNHSLEYLESHRAALEDPNEDMKEVITDAILLATRNHSHRPGVTEMIERILNKMHQNEPTFDDLTDLYRLIAPECCEPAPLATVVATQVSSRTLDDDSGEGAAVVLAATHLDQEVKQAEATAPRAIVETPEQTRKRRQAERVARHNNNNSGKDKVYDRYKERQQQREDSQRQLG